MSAGIIGFALGLMLGTWFGVGIAGCLAAAGAEERALENLRNVEKRKDDDNE